MGHVHTCNAHRNSGGVEGYFCVQKMEIPGKRGGGGYGYFLERHNVVYIIGHCHVAIHKYDEYILICKSNHDVNTNN